MPRYREFPVRLTITVALIIGVCMGGAALARGLSPQYWVVLGLASSALAIALVSAFRGVLLEFSPQVLGGDVILPRSTRADGEMEFFLLPLQFVNAGFADGVVEWIALRLTLDAQGDRQVLLTPVAEVDMQKFIQARRNLDPANTIEPFTSFPLEAKRSLAKFVLFTLADKPRVDPPRLAPGRYAFELFMKTSNTRRPKLERTFEHVLQQKDIDEYLKDGSIYLINNELTLPLVRREAAGALR